MSGLLLSRLLREDRGAGRGMGYFLAPDPAAAEVDRMVVADIMALAPDLSKVPQQPKAPESK